MPRPRRKLVYIRPDGVEIRVDVGNFAPGKSLFVPCLNNKLAVDGVMKHLRVNGRKVTKHELCWCPTIYKGHLGVRIWWV
jgi:hypothetical protein